MPQCSIYRNCHCRKPRYLKSTGHGFPDVCAAERESSLAGDNGIVEYKTTIKINKRGCMTREELIEILKTGLDEQEIQDLNIGKLVKLPGAKGCIKLNNEWFVYGSQDERGNISFNGPFDDSALIYAIAKIFCKSNLFQLYKFSDKMYKIFLHNHFSSIEEIKEKYPELN